MPDLIRILPETLINKIAAGEVVQRPASVVKELVENSIDAQAKNIIINIQDAGKTLIQVLDNGIGMSQTDARLAFERHATSKIYKIDDLFNITTKGFRGEALASIAAVSHIEMKTRREKDKIGTQVIIEGGKFVSQQPVSCSKGTNILVKNLFFNVPARRKFLKSDQTEFKHILNEFFRVAIPHHYVKFELYHNKAPIYKLKPALLKERLINLFDKNYNKYLIPIETDSGFVKIYGYIGIPQAARKKYAEQFFFVNNRFFKSSYLHHAVIKAFEKVLSAELKPLYFIFFEIDPSRIDVNIHPTKIEVNFQDADSIYQILISAIKLSLAQYGVVPMIDFDTEAFISKTSINQEIENFNLTDIEEVDYYNSFEDDEKKIEKKEKKTNNNLTFQKNKDYVPKNWQQIYENTPSKQTLPKNELQHKTSTNNKFINFKNKYIITSLKSGLAIINIKRAYETIFYHEIINILSNNQLSSQQTIYPIQISLNHRQLQNFQILKSEFEKIGYKFEQISNTNYNIISIPSFFDMKLAYNVVIDLVDELNTETLDLQQMTIEYLSLILSRSKARIQNTNLNEQEMEVLVTKLFVSPSPKLSPSGKKNFHILKLEEIDKFFRQ